MATATKERRKKADGGISLSVAELKAALNLVRSVVPAQSPRPVLTNVLLSGDRMSGSDGDIRVDIQLENAPPGVHVLLPRDRFWKILQTTKAFTLAMTIDGNSCVVKDDNAEWALPTADADEYPAWKVNNAKPIAKLPADQFVRAIESVKKSTDTESSRYALGGVMVEVVGEFITFVTTDGRRLSCATLEHDGAVDNSSCLVPCFVFTKALSLIPKKTKRAKTDDDDAEEHRDEYDCDNLAVQIESSANEIVVTIGQMDGQIVSPWRVVTGRLLDGKFPIWRESIPGRTVASTKVNRQALLAATEAAAIVSSEQSKGVQFTFCDSGIKLHGQSPNCGESNVKCDIVSLGKTCKVKLDPKFLIEWLNGIASDEDPHAFIEAVDGSSAVVLRCGKDEENGTFTYTGVIMPLAQD